MADGLSWQLLAQFAKKLGCKLNYPAIQRVLLQAILKKGYQSILLKLFVFIKQVRDILIGKNLLKRLFRKNSNAWESVAGVKLCVCEETWPFNHQRDRRDHTTGESLLWQFQRPSEDIPAVYSEQELEKQTSFPNGGTPPNLLRSLTVLPTPECLPPDFAKSCRRFCLLRPLWLCNIAYWGYVIQLKQCSDKHYYRLHTIALFLSYIQNRQHFSCPHYTFSIAVIIKNPKQTITHCFCWSEDLLQWLNM